MARRDGGRTAARPPQDPYAQRLKTLTSAAQRLRGWTSSDSSRRPELVDALLDLTAHRLRGHLYAAAGNDAQEAVRLATEVMLASGPVGPYTRAEDATRVGRSLIHLATVQQGVGLTEAAGTTIASWDVLRAQIGAAGTEADLDQVSVVWALAVAGRASLSRGETDRANAYVDAASGRLDGSADGEPGDGLDGVITDVDRLRSDARWAGGHTADALGSLHRAHERHDRLVAGRLEEPNRYPPALIERLAEPVFGLHRDLADRLAGCGEAELGLQFRRTCLRLLRGLVGRGAASADQLVATLTDLAADLDREHRTDEARSAADEAVRLAGDSSVAASTRLLAWATATRIGLAAGETVDLDGLTSVLAQESDAAAPATVLAMRALADGLSAEGEVEAAQAIRAQADDLAPTGSLEDLARGVVSRGASPLTWDRLLPEQSYPGPAVQAAPDEASPLWLVSERERAHRLETDRAEQASRDAEEQRRRDAERAQAEQEQAAAREAARQAEQRRLAEARAEADRAEQIERKRRREERLREHQRELDRRVAEDRAARRADLQTRIDRLESKTPSGPELRELELLRLELADLTPEPPEESAEPAEAPVEADDRASAEPFDGLRTAPFDGLRTTPDEPFDGLRTAPFDELRTAPFDELRTAPFDELRTAPDELERARAAWVSARDAGDRRSARAALEHLVDVLRPRAESDFADHALEFHAALTDLASARLRSGDLFGSRSISKEAKALGRRLPR